jgi:hypothetical protein
MFFSSSSVVFTGSDGRSGGRRVPRFHLGQGAGDQLCRTAGAIFGLCQCVMLFIYVMASFCSSGGGGCQSRSVLVHRIRGRWQCVECGIVVESNIAQSPCVKCCGFRGGCQQVPQVGCRWNVAWVWLRPCARHVCRTKHKMSGWSRRCSVKRMRKLCAMRRKSLPID